MSGRLRFVGLLAIALSPFAPTLAQTNNSSSVSPSNPPPQQSWVVRDPVTGRIFQQSVVSVAVPTTQWEVRPITRTVYQPTNTIKSQPIQQTTYTPHTHYVVQPRLRGWWKPSRQTERGFQSVPITSWQPQTQTIDAQVPTVQWLPQQQIVYVPQPVQRMQKQQQVVSTEIPQPWNNSLGTQAPPRLAAQSQPLLRIPLLAQQRVLPWPRGSSSPAAQSTSQPSSLVSSGLRPLTNGPLTNGPLTNGPMTTNNPAHPNYSAPLRTAAVNGTATRDTFQTGMAVTELR